MTDEVISRRQLLATGVQATAALAVAGALGPAATADAQPATLTFYDPRFPASRLRARALPGRPQLRPIHGDPTAVLGLVSGARASGLRRLQGVTTESIPFCLREFAGRGRGIKLESRRVDRDLFAWTLILGNEPSNSTSQPT
jgi:hypothetical protein